MAGSFPFVQKQFTPQSNIAVNPGGKGGPQVQYPIGSAIGGGGSRGLGYGTQGVRGQLRKRLEDDVPEAARFPQEERLPDIGGNPPTPNIYRGILGFENYTGGPRIQGDALSAWNRIKAVPGQNGYPTRDRVQEISNAMQQFGSIPVQAPRGSMGQGLAPNDYMDAIKRLLRERMGGY